MPTEYDVDCTSISHDNFILSATITFRYRPVMYTRVIILYSNGVQYKTLIVHSLYFVSLELNVNFNYFFFFFTKIIKMLYIVTPVLFIKYMLSIAWKINVIILSVYILNISQIQYPDYSPPLNMVDKYLIR
jgi:hypothetical protein